MIMSNPALPLPPIGWPLLPQPDETGSLAYPTLEQSVRDQIRIILLTRPGEQLMRPEFGAGLENYVHEPNTLATRRRIRCDAKRQLDRRPRGQPFHACRFQALHVVANLAAQLILAVEHVFLLQSIGASRG